MNLEIFADQVISYGSLSQKRIVPGVYGLCDPVTRKVRYVGHSLNISRRLYEHCKVSPSSKSPKDVWIRELRQRGMQPYAMILQRFPDYSSLASYVAAEKHWIELSGADLNIHMTPINHPRYKDTEHKRLSIRVEQLEKELRELKGKL